MDILFSLFNVNFIEYQKKCFSFLKEYLKHGDLSDVLHFIFNKEQTLSFFLVWLKGKYQKRSPFCVV